MFPTRASAPALTDLIGGHVAMYFSSLPPAVALVKDGKVRALAVTGAKRSPIFPDLPTVAEAGAAGLRGGAALRHRRAGRHAAADHRQAQRRAARRGDVRRAESKRLAADGAEPLASTPEEYAADIDREETKWSAIVKKSGAKVD